MEPERVRAYLQVACAGLGFDIGEIWWTSGENGSTAVMAIEEKNNETGSEIDPSETEQERRDRKLRFMQLYTSKSYSDRRSMLVNPDEDPGHKGLPDSNEDLEKHVLSPRLVDAISQTAQVVWANCEKSGGLLGRSDMKLQTAVGMPVAVDAEGNMCVVVMFSPENVESTDDAMEYLQFISRSATSSSIPCLLPVFDSKTMKPALQDGDEKPEAHHNHHHRDPSLGDGVVAHFVTLEDSEHHHELKDAPKDCFGIPMLPSFAELGGASEKIETGSESPHSDAFDEASFGLWSTIMDGGIHAAEEASQKPNFSDETYVVDKSNGNDALTVMELHKPMMPAHQRERLEEFASAFLAMSVFDVTDVWIPTGSQGFDSLCHVTSVTSTDTNETLNEFKRASRTANIKLWSGAVGRAYASGNPVWSANFRVFVDSGREPAFEKANIRAVVAVPIYSAGAVSPGCVLACYSLVRADPVPTVLRFIQQALRLLWTGLERVEPHESIGRERWKDVAPADLGEMAADVEMQQAFLQKKRPHSSISTSPPKATRDRSSSLAMQLQSLGLPSGDSEAPYVGQVLLPSGENEQGSAVITTTASPSQVPIETYNLLQSHLQDAVRAVGEAVPWDGNQRVATNAEGTKRAHIVGQLPEQNLMLQPLAPAPPPSSTVPLQAPQLFPNQFVAQSNGPVSAAPVPDTVLSGQNYLLNLHSVSPSPQITATPAQPELLSAGEASYSRLQLAPAAAVSLVPEQVTSCFQTSPFLAAAESMTAGFKVCRIQGCDQPAVTRRPYCSRHSGNRLCEHPGCAKCAQGSTRFCIAHGGGRRCTYPGCDKGARDKFFCAAHGGGKRCSFEGCTKSAVGGSKLCTSHGGGRRCAVEGCDKSAQSSTKFCVKHGGGKKCAHEGCQKVARGRTRYCAAHGGGIRCKLEGCNRVAIGKLQLCRAHGGGSRSRHRSAPLPAPPPQFSDIHVMNPTPIQPGRNGTFSESMLL